MAQLTRDPIPSAFEDAFRREHWILPDPQMVLAKKDTMAREERREEIHQAIAGLAFFGLLLLTIGWIFLR